MDVVCVRDSWETRELRDPSQKKKMWGKLHHHRVCCVLHFNKVGSEPGKIFFVNQVKRKGGKCTKRKKPVTTQHEQNNSFFFYPE